MKKEAPGGGLGVDAVGDALEMHLPRFQFVNQVHRKRLTIPTNSGGQSDQSKRLSNPAVSAL